MGRPLSKKWFGNLNTNNSGDNATNFGTTTNGGTAPKAGQGIGGDSVASVTITTAGTYTAGLPTVTFSDPNLLGVSGVRATGTVRGKLVTASTTVNGAGYAYDQVLTVPGGTSTTAATVRVSAITVATATKHLNTGAAYEDGDTITFSTGWDTPCVLRVNRPGGGSGSADDYTIINPGVRSQAAQTNPVSPDSTSDGDGNGAQVTFTYGVYSLEVVEIGDYTAMPSNDVTFTGGTTGAQATLTFGVKGITITNPGSGYTTAADAVPAFSGGGTAAGTAVLTTDGGTPYTRDAFNTIIAYGITAQGGNNLIADIVKQQAGRRYKIKTSEGIAYAVLKTTGVASELGEMTITATDSAACTYYVKKLTAHKATLVPYGAGSHVFPLVDGEPQSAQWSMNAASGSIVQIQNA
jgi:hypothetical protein